MGQTFVDFRRWIKKGLGFFICMFVFCYFVVAQGAAFSWDFSDCEIKDILFAVSIDTGISIVPDDTVSGKGDFKFAGGDFNLAFESFLKRNRLFVKRDGVVWTVSRILVSKENDSFSVEAYDLLPVQIIEKLSKVMDKVVTFETLPVQRISVCFRNVSEDVLMECFAKRFGVYDVMQEEAGYHFVKKNDVQNANRLQSDLFSEMVKIEVLKDSCDENHGYGTIFVDVEDARLSVVLNELFDQIFSEKKSFCFLSDADCKIQRSVFIGSDFEDTLHILCAQCGFDFVQENGVYYFFSNSSIREELVSGKRIWCKITLRFTKSQDFLTFVLSELAKLKQLCFQMNILFYAL